MSNRILKRRIELGVVAAVPGRPIHFAMQDYEPTVWFRSHEHHAMTREVLAVGTGHEFDDSWWPLMSTSDGPFVWHLLVRDPDAPTLGLP